MGITGEDLIAFSLAYNESGKAPVKLIKDYLNTLLQALDSLGVKTLYCADANYFKVLAGQRKAEPHIGVVLPCNIEGFEHMSVVLGVNHASLFYNPNNEAPLKRTLDALARHMGGEEVTIGQDIIKSETYITTIEEAEEYLSSLLDEPELTADIEAFSLKHHSAGIGTIGFAVNEGEGTVIQCDYRPLISPEEVDVWCNKDKKYKKKLAYGKRVNNHPMRDVLKWFFNTYKGKIIWHNASYDIKVIIYELWMEEDITNHVGLLAGLEVMTRNFDCTRLITYLATNNCAGNKLSLKDIAHEFAGNYAQDEINDIRLIEPATLMRYNLIDCLCTWYAKNKNFPIMVQDAQEELYEGLFKESLITIIQMELTGMPLNMDEVHKGKHELREIFEYHNDRINQNMRVHSAITLMQYKWIEKDFEDRYTKSKNPEKIVKRNIEELLIKAPATFPRLFNANSGQQVGLLLHEVLGLPVIETTPSGQPAADDDTLKALKNHTEDEEVKHLIEDIRGQLGVDKILSTFIPAFEQAVLGKDGIHYLFGCFNLGGTKSGRLSSSNPVK